jgi:hypothetical protein
VGMTPRARVTMGGVFVTFRTRAVERGAVFVRRLRTCSAREEVVVSVIRLFELRHMVFDSFTRYLEIGVRKSIADHIAICNIKYLITIETRPISNDFNL